MDLRKVIREIQDFPKEGVSFKDVTTLLKDADAYKFAIDKLVEICRPLNADVIACPEARGFVVGAPMAYLLGTGVVPVRKPGKLPAEAISQSYGLEYGEDELEIHVDAILPGQKVIIADDLLATGGTALAAAKLVERLGGVVVGFAFISELLPLGGRELLKDYNVISLVEYEDA